MKLTRADKDKLATFCGLKKEYPECSRGSSYLFNDGTGRYIEGVNWKPGTDAWHILMVLDAFGKHPDVQYYSITMRQFPKGKLGWLSASMTQEWADRNDNKPFRVDGSSIGEIACQAGLEVIRENKP